MSLHRARYQHMMQRALLMRGAVGRRATSSVTATATRSLHTSMTTLQAATKRHPTAAAAAAAASVVTPASSSSSASSASGSSSPNLRQTECGLWVDHSLPSNFKKVLIANRGEIACRVIRTCRELGIRTVAVYSDADAQSRHVQMADEAYRIGEAPASQSYLLGDKIIAIAKSCGAQAIHPGYGFLSENAKFARACEQAGVEFIGPPATAIEAMGSKSASKIIMTEAGVPVVPGYHGEDQSAERLAAEAVKCGFPIMLKAVLGGGGKGMRIVYNAEEFPENLEACKREALKSFGDERVLLERYIVRPRHIEFQVFADKQGNAVHLFERDCSVQRRHQKVLEEAPAPGMTDELRAHMGRAAVNAAKAVGYVGAGTVEFIFDADVDPSSSSASSFFFMEMNTRLQVEHPVTEMIMRRDLVQWQLHVAHGGSLPATQEQLHNVGHAIEARVYAENPNNNFLPATGKLVHLSPPEASGNLRVESGVRTGDEVSIFYDPMISKLCVWGRDRGAALDALAAGLRSYQIVGPPTNIPFLLRSVDHPAFRQGRVETGFIAQNIADLLPIAKPGQTNKVHAAFALLYLLHSERAAAAKAAATSVLPSSPWFRTDSLRLNNSNEARHVELLVDNYTNNEGEIAEEKIKLAILPVPTSGAIHDRFEFKFPDGTILTVQGRPRHQENAQQLYATVGDRAFHATVIESTSGDKHSLHVFVDGSQSVYRLPDPRYVTGEVGAGGCVAPMAGKVVKVSVTPGAAVKKGQPLVIMEAMKMEHVIRAPRDGIVQAIVFAQGDFVEGGKTVVTFAEAPKK